MLLMRARRNGTCCAWSTAREPALEHRLVPPFVEKREIPPGGPRGSGALERALHAAPCFVTRRCHLPGGVASVPMTVPEGLDPAGRAAWRRAVETLTAIGEVPERSAGALERYARSVDTLATMRRRWIADGRPVLSSGSHRQVRMHPAIAGIAAQERLIADLAAALLLTPAARARAGRARGGRPQGTSQAPDRRGLRPVTTDAA